MEEAKPEEKSPLLLYLVDGEGGASKNNKRVNFDKGRLYGISSGATAVFTDFPNYISPCWITALLSSLIFFMLVLLMLSPMAYPNGHRVPRCTHGRVEDFTANKTIHLVNLVDEWNQEQLELLEQIKNEYSGYNVNLVLMRPWVQRNNVIAVQPITESTSQNASEISTNRLVKSTAVGVNQAVIEIKRAKRSKKNTRNPKRKKRDYMDKMGPMGIGFGVKSLLDILLRSKLETNEIIKRNSNDSKLLTNLLNLTATAVLPVTTVTARPKTLDDVTNDFPGLIVRNVTIEEAFSNSPLKNDWLKLSKDLTIFAVRVLYLWQYGGMSFQVNDGDGGRIRWEEVGTFSMVPDDPTLQTTESNSLRIEPLLPPPPLANDKLLGFILDGRSTFEHLAKEVVTADDEGLHMFTNTPCHVFFGEIIMNLKKAEVNETPKNIIQKSLKVFCKRAAVGNNYCKKLMISQPSV